MRPPVMLRVRVPDGTLHVVVDQDREAAFRAARVWASGAARVLRRPVRIERRHRRAWHLAELVQPDPAP